ncbi:aromatic acid exporter family protein [Enterococcus pallens]|uniref:Putative aromatic acid exporter C-terminal domain-containing protein n=1 Tax=Enterococcus pallens ATCC BAA-351 TaxID=1158607 RepID=R2PZK7_9ENTE|nr:aromatic acid exporter family protein [Enterococcus pallens]EOH88543.1 hypothetical protein UAU_04362 [Enterococcus pallens ATCC BAA-351]EOU17724.1 hypothetical protein I588_02711 [Enterococcus pallens ATCC BAA-351]
MIQRLALWNHLLYALKIGIGSGVSIYIAESLQLEYASSAGIITLLTIASTRSETLRIGLHRIITFIGTVVLCGLMNSVISAEWVAYGIVMVVLTFALSLRDLLKTLSGNAVVVSHLLRAPDQIITIENLVNEFSLLLIGLVIAIVVNNFQNCESQKKYLEKAVESTDREMQKIFYKLSAYLKDPTLNNQVWEDIIQLEKDILGYTAIAFQYQQNRLPRKDHYYVNYFEMRLQQSGVLHNLHYEMKNIRVFQSDSQIVAEFLDSMIDDLSKMNSPLIQLRKVADLILYIQQNNLSTTREEFISKVRLYHIVMNIEEFLKFKERFVATLDK